jgi:glutamine synthetase
MSTAVKAEALTVPRVVVARLERVRRGKRTVFEATVPKPAAEPHPARVAITLALAHAIRRAIDAGEIRDQAHVAQKFGTTRARVTQLLDLTFLAPRIQEEILKLTAASKPVNERMLREICRHESWGLQQEQRLF